MEKKRIKILTSGAIRVKGFINGPVLTPYFEDINTIFAMLSSGIHVVEVCDDNAEIRLTTSNLTEDNSKAARDARYAATMAKMKSDVANIRKERTESKVSKVVEEDTKEEKVESEVNVIESQDDETVVDTKVEDVVEEDSVAEAGTEPKEEPEKSVQTNHQQYNKQQNYNKNKNKR